MSKILKLIPIVVALTMLLLPALGEMNGGGSDGGSMDSGSSDAGSTDSSRSDSRMPDSSSDGGNSMHEKVREMYDNGSRMRESEDMKGMEFMHREDSNYGSYVTFSVDNTTGDVLNYGISGEDVFDSIKISGFDFKTSITEGAETRIIDKDGSNVIQIHDNPAAAIEIHSNKRSSLIFNLAAGASASKQDNIVKIIAGNITEYIASEKATSINIAGSQVSIDTDIGNTVIRASPVNMPHDDMEERFMDEVNTNRAGAEVSVGESDKYSIVNYSEDVNVTVESIETDRMRMKVDSSDHAGKFILMNIDNSSLKWDAGDRISLYLDNKMMKEVMTEQELYAASESSFWLNKPGSNRMQVLAYIQNFSTHEVDIIVSAAATQTQTVTPTPSLTTTVPGPKTPGFGLVMGVIATLAAVYIARKRL